LFESRPFSRRHPGLFRTVFECGNNAGGVEGFVHVLVLVVCKVVPFLGTGPGAVFCRCRCVCTFLLLLYTSVQYSRARVGCDEANKLAPPSKELAVVQRRFRGVCDVFVWVQPQYTFVPALLVCACVGFVCCGFVGFLLFLVIS